MAQAYCWGRNYYGQIGNGTSSTSTTYSTPQAVNTNTVTSYSSLSVGSNFACGLRSGTGAAYCWGRGDLNQLGNGTRLTIVHYPLLLRQALFRVMILLP